MTTLAIAAVTAAALVALALWWIRRTNLAAVAVTGGASCGGCDSRPARQLFFAASAEPPTSGGSGAGAAGGSAAAGGAPKRRKRSGPSRRAFLRTSMGVGFLGVLGGFGGATLQFLWPDLRGGFGAVLDAGTEDEILDYIQTNREPYEFAPGRTYFVAYDGAQDPDGQYDEITDGQQAQVMALYWRCVHLGCKVPWCHSSQWLECPCHGSRYNRWGEWQGGPAPRGLDRFAVEIQDGHVFVDTAAVITGPTRQSPALDQPAEGPTCT
jgi:cytochrome b6-f complex iron-sulfur subunit